jgi:hypothetical protein
VPPEFLSHSGLGQGRHDRLTPADSIIAEIMQTLKHVLSSIENRFIEIYENFEIKYILIFILSKTMIHRRTNLQGDKYKF